ncbi:MAG: DNA polymerase III subunit chi [bacterium]
MTEFLFYHLERARLEQVLPDLLEKSLSRNWQAFVLCQTEEQADHIDELLWTYQDNSFLPHGRQGNGHPVLISVSAEIPPATDIVFLTYGTIVSLEVLDRLQRCIVIFDAADEPAMQTAREFWREVKDSKAIATYWRQSAQGKWEKQS